MTQTFVDTLGVHGTTAEDGTARLELEATEAHLDPAGTLHGSGARSPRRPAAVQGPDASVRAVGGTGVLPLHPGAPGHLQATGRVVTQGEHLTVCEADVEQDGRTLVHAVATFAVLHR